MKTKKIIALLLVAVIAFSLSGCSLLEGIVSFKLPEIELPDFLSFLKGDPYKGMTEEEKLVAVGTWEKYYAPATYMVFNSDGTGKQHHNGYDYDYYWSLDDGILCVELVGATTYNYVFEMLDESFTVTNADAGTTAEFVYGGSQVTEFPDNGTNPAQLVGDWVSDDTDLYAWVLNADGTGYRYNAQNSSAATVNIEWTYVKKTKTLYFHSDNWENMLYYNYSVNDDVLLLINLSTGDTLKFNNQR